MIRLGDLHRYVRKPTLARIYYLNARKLDVMRGHAYNQLAIVTPLTEPLKCIYYSTRAARACVEPTLVAESNLKMAINRIDSEHKYLLRQIFDDGLDFGGDDNEYYPHVGIDWFYLAVIAVYAHKIKPIFKPLIEYVSIHSDDYSNNENTENNDFNFSLMAFDVLLDWLSLNDAKKTHSEEYAKECRDLKLKLNNCMETLCAHKNTTESNPSRALFHDYLLRGFSPLQEIHKTLQFENEEVLEVEFYPLILRVSEKLEKLVGKLVKPKKIRNVALGSILEKSQTSSN